jgi:enolase
MQQTKIIKETEHLRKAALDLAVDSLKNETTYNFKNQATTKNKELIKLAEEFYQFLKKED